MSQTHSTNDRTTTSAASDQGGDVPGLSTADQPERSLTQLISDLSEQTTRLVRTEARLAAREMATKARRAGRAGGALATAATLAAYAGALLLASLALGLATVMPAWLSTLIVGGALLLAAGGAALIARSELRKALPPMPDDTITRVREDVDTVRERTHQ